MGRVFAGSGSLLLALHLATVGVPPSARADGLERLDEDPGPPIEGWIAHQLLSYQTGLARFEVEEVARTIESESLRHALSRDLILSVIRTESGFYNRARSKAGALGLMQIMPATGKMIAEEIGLAWEGERTLFNPVANVRIGVTYLAQLHRRYGSWKLALAAYNWGPGRIDRRLRRGRALPVRYATRILSALGSPTAP